MSARLYRDHVYARALIYARRAYRRKAAFAVIAGGFVIDRQNNRGGVSVPQVEFALADLKWKFDVSPRAIRAMLRDYRKYAPMECQGSLFAVADGDNRRIEVAVGPGPHPETPSPISAYPDLKFFHRWRKRLKGGGFHLCGFWHSHPFQDVPCPSHGDVFGCDWDKDDTGWFRWDKEYMRGEGHFEAIVARKRIRTWYVHANKDTAYLVADIEIPAKQEAVRICAG